MTLTDRQAQIAAKVALGMTNQQIAAALKIRPPTVKAHLSAIFDKLRVPNRTALAAWVARSGRRGP